VQTSTTSGGQCHRVVAQSLMRLKKYTSAVKRRIHAGSRVFLKLKSRDFSDQFSTHEALVDESWAPVSQRFAVAILPQTLNLEVKDLLESLSEVDLRSRMVEVESEHLLLSVLPRNEVDAFVRSYRGWELPHKHPTWIALQRWTFSAFTNFFVSPVSVVNSRAWLTTSSLEFGAFRWHTDGFRPGHLKIMIYPDGLSEKSGGLEIEDSRIHSAEPGTAVAFQNSNLRHRAIPSREGGGRLAIEVTFQRTLCQQLQRFPSHFNGRHLKNAKYFYGPGR
jgi:hypothetical protein